MDYDENMNAMVNAAGAEAIKPAEIDAREAYARGRREAIEEAALYLEDVGGKKEDGVIIAAAGWITEHEAELNAKGPRRGK